MPSTFLMVAPPWFAFRQPAEGETPLDTLLWVEGADPAGYRFEFLPAFTDEDAGQEYLAAIDATDCALVQCLDFEWMQQTLLALSGHFPGALLAFDPTVNITRTVPIATLLHGVLAA